MANPFTSNKFKLLNVRTAAKILGGEDNPLSISTLAMWRSKGIGPNFIKVGNSIRYKHEDLLAYLESSTSTAENGGDLS